MANLLDIMKRCLRYKCQTTNTNIWISASIETLRAAMGRNSSRRALRTLIFRTSGVIGCYFSELNLLGFSIAS